MGAGRRALLASMGRQAKSVQQNRPQNYSTGECVPCKAKAAASTYKGKVEIKIDKS